MPDTTMHLFWGYTAFWLCVALYVFIIRREQGEQRKRINILQENIQSLRK